MVPIKHAPTCTASVLATLLQRVLQLYSPAGFHPCTIMMDMEFEKVKDKLLTIVVNTTTAREHVAEVKQKIRVVKERAQGVVSTLPFTRLPKTVLVKLMHFVVM